MKSKLLILIVTAALLLCTVLSSASKTRVSYSTSVSLAGVIGGGIYWYVSVGTTVSKKDSNIKVALLDGNERSLYVSPNAVSPSSKGPELYLPLYNLIF